MKKTMRLLYMLVVAMMSVYMASCRTSRNGTYATASGNPDVMISVSDARVALRQTVAAYGEWERVKIPLTVRIASPKQLSVGASIEMQRGEYIYISMRYLGVEVCSMWATSDSVTVVDRMHKCYVSEPVSGFLGGFPVNVSNLQDLFLGRVFVLGQSEVVSKNITAGEIDTGMSGNYIFVPESVSDKLEYGFSLSDVNGLMSFMVQAGDHDPVKCFYGNPAVTGFGPVASDLKINAVAGKTGIDATLEYNISKIKWNTEVKKRELDIPGGYRRIPASDVMRMMSGL